MDITNDLQINDEFLAAHQLVALVLLCFMIIYIYRARYQVIQQNIRRSLLWTELTLGSWLTTVILVYQFSDKSLVNRLYRYGNLVFPIVFGITAFYLLLYLGHPDGPRVPLFLRWIFHFTYSSLITVILTNEWHHLLFSDYYPDVKEMFPLGLRITNYMIIAMYLLIFVMFCVKIYRLKSSHLTFLLSLFQLMTVIYLVDAYYRNYLDEKEETLVLVGLFLFFIVIINNSGLIPNNKNYQKLFENSGLKMSILDEEGNLLYQTKDFESISRDVVLRMMENVENGKEEPFFYDRPRLLYMGRLDGGYVIYDEDVSELQKLREEYQVALDKTLRTNELLAKENSQIHAETKDRVVRDLLDGIEKDIFTQMDELPELVKKLKDSKLYWIYLAYIMLRLVFVKRHCILYFIGQQSPVIPADEFCVYIDELADFSKYANIRFITVNRIREDVPIGVATTFYDYFGAFIYYYREKGSVVLMEEFDANAQEFAMHVMSSDEIAKPEDILSGELLDKIEKEHGHLENKSLDDAYDYSLHIPKGGAEV